MKRTLTIILALLLAATLCACSAAVIQPLPQVQPAAEAEAVPEAEAPAPEAAVPAPAAEGGIRIVLTNKSDAAIPLLATYNMAAFQAGAPSLTLSVFELEPNESSNIDITAEDVTALEELGYLTRADDGAAFTLRLGVAACQNITDEDRAADVAPATFVGELAAVCRFGTDIQLEWDGTTFMQTNPAIANITQGA